MRLTSLALCALLCACTIAPKPVVSSAPSEDGNQANSGLIGRLPDGGYEITANAEFRYNQLIARGFSKAFLTPLKVGEGLQPLENGHYEIDAEHLVDFGVMQHAFNQTLGK